MNILDEFRQHPARVLDRLADGELADDDRSLLLASLDDQPGAWRDCALAFLEAQQFRHEFGAMARERALPRVAVPEKAVAQSRDGAKWLALAASVLVAFLLGTRFAPLHPAAHDLAQLTPADRTEPNHDAQADVQPALADDLQGEDIDSITLAWDDGERVQTFKLPIVNVPSLDPEWLANMPSSLSPSLVEELREAGLEVRSQHEFWPVQLSDGRQVIVPIEQVEISEAEYY